MAEGVRSKEYPDRIQTVGVIILRGDEVLLVKHGEKAGHLTGVYGFPSGRVEPNETEEKAAGRELEEETGLKAESLKEFSNNFYLGDLPRKNGEILKATFRVFLCNEYSGELTATEETKPEWVKISSLDSYWLLPHVKEAIEGAQKVK